MNALDGTPLSAEDRAILALECDTLAGHTCMVVVLDADAPSSREIAARVAERIVAAEPLTWRLGGTPDRPAWVPDPAFDPGAHVHDVPVETPLEPSGLALEVARLFEQRLDRAPAVEDRSSGAAGRWRRAGVATPPRARRRPQHDALRPRPAVGSTSAAVAAGLALHAS